MLSTLTLGSVSQSDRAQVLEAAFAGYALPIRTRFTQVGAVDGFFAERMVGRTRVERFDLRGVSGTATRGQTDADSAVQPTVTLHVMTAGHLVVRHAGRVSALSGTTLLFTGTTSPLEMTQGTASAMNTISIPMRDAGISPQRLQASINRPFRGSDPVAATAVALLERLTSDVVGEPDQPWEALESTLVSLVRALAFMGTAAERDAAGPLAETLSDRVLHHIERHALDSSLSAQSIAAAHDISVRYLYVILRARDISLGEHVRGLRLEHAARLLGDDRYRQSTIADVAYLAGFSDHAHFSRSFRKRYEESPGDWRRRRLR